jgi:hypothetical protein
LFLLPRKEQSVENIVREIEDELARLALDDEFFCCLARPPDDGSLVVLDGDEEAIVYQAAGLLRVLQECADDAGWREVEEAIRPWRVDSSS